MHKNLKEHFFYFFPIVLATIITCGVIYAWSEPPAAPTVGNVASPISTRDQAQHKLGKLTVGQSSKVILGDPVTKIAIEAQAAPGGAAGVFNGNVGIGINPSGGPLVVLGATSINDALRIMSDTNGEYLNLWRTDSNPDAGHIQVGDSSTWRNLILEENGGNVGIGNINPKSPAPNGQNGNLDVNDVYLRSTGKWVSQTIANFNHHDCYTRSGDDRYSTNAAYCDSGDYVVQIWVTGGGEHKGVAVKCCQLP